MTAADRGVPNGYAHNRCDEVHVVLVIACDHAVDQRRGAAILGTSHRVILRRLSSQTGLGLEGFGEFGYPFAAFAAAEAGLGWYACGPGQFGPGGDTAVADFSVP